MISAAISVLSVVVAAISLFISIKKDSGDELAKARRDWQKGFVFSTLVSSAKPMTIGQIETTYKTEANKVRERYKLTDKNFSTEEIYSVLIEMLGTQAIKMPDISSFSVRTDDDAAIDRRLAFEMMQFARAHEYQFPYSEFALEFANWYLSEKQVSITKDKALSLLMVAMQNNLVGMVPKPNDPIKCLGEIKPLFVASMFQLRLSAPMVMPMPGTVLQPCPPDKP
jgi:hypothetical protein